MATGDETYTARRLTVEVPGVHEFQQLYERAVPANPVEEIATLVQRGASWAEVIDTHAELARHGFLIYWRNDIHGVMQLANSDNDCSAYLMGSVTTAHAASTASGSTCWWVRVPATSRLAATSGLPPSR